MGAKGKQGSRSYAGIRATTSRQSLSWAEARVSGSLARLGIPSAIARVEDEAGLSLDVAVPAGRLEAAHRWRLAFGRSHGPVRINLKAEG